MKVALPLEDDKISFHFGRWFQFAFFEMENDRILSKEIVDVLFLKRRSFFLNF